MLVAFYPSTSNKLYRRRLPNMQNAEYNASGKQFWEAILGSNLGSKFRFQISLCTSENLHQCRIKPSVLLSCRLAYCLFMDEDLRCTLEQYECHGVTVRDVLDQYKDTPRDLHCLESWCGAGRFEKVSKRRNLEAVGLDKRRGAHMDFEQVTGFMFFCSQVVRLVPRGCHLASPERSSYHKFINARNTKRCSNNPDGDTGYAPCVQGNLFANMTAFMVCLGILRDVHTLIETPEGSWLHDISSFKPIISRLELAGLWFWCITYGCQFTTKLTPPGNATA